MSIGDKNRMRWRFRPQTSGLGTLKLQKSCQTKVITVSIKNNEHDQFNEFRVEKIEELPEEVMNYIFSFLNIQ